MITWNDSEEEDQEKQKQDEIANICFMALNDDVEIQNSLVDDDILYDELSIAYDELLINFEKLATKATLLKKKNASLFNELEKILVLEKENENLTNENISLKERVDDLTKVVHKFILRKKTFDMIVVSGFLSTIVASGAESQKSNQCEHAFNCYSSRMPRHHKGVPQMNE